jgi:recombination protein RecR
MSGLPRPLIELSRLISKMPGISSRGAERFLDWWWRRKIERDEFLKYWQEFSAYRPCIKCFYFAHEEICDFCADDSRVKDQICVVGSSFTAAIVDKEAEYRGRYFVLDGDAVGARAGKEIEAVKERIAFLKGRIGEEKITEVILATDFTTRGEATSLYLQNELKELPVKVTRLGRGLHSGDSLGYSDAVTLKSAFLNRS